MRLTARPGRVGDAVADFAWYVGIDWGSETHVVCLLNASGQIEGTRTVVHTAVAVQEAVQWMRDRRMTYKAERLATGEGPRR